MPCSFFTVSLHSQKKNKFLASPKCICFFKASFTLFYKRKKNASMCKVKFLGYQALHTIAITFLHVKESH